jgi:hypothetical protein
MVQEPYGRPPPPQLLQKPAYVFTFSFPHSCRNSYYLMMIITGSEIDNRSGTVLAGAILGSVSLFALIILFGVRHETEGREETQ